MNVPQQTASTSNTKGQYEVTKKLLINPQLYQDVVDEMESNPDDPAQLETLGYASRLESARVRPTDKIEKQPGCLFIIKDGKEYVFGSMGDISTITGKQKSKKTIAVSIAVAAAVSQTTVINRVRGQLPDGQNTVLLFDTEQSQYHVWQAVKRICTLCGIEDPLNLIVYSLRSFAPDERLSAIDEAVNNTPDVGLVVIDGVRDLAVDPILDNAQANHIITRLLQWTANLQIHIITVLHQNKADGNVRGVLGTELVNKSETVLEVIRDEKEPAISRVEPKDCRNPNFPPFAFQLDEHGIPTVVDIAPCKERNATLQNNKQGGRKKEKPTAESMSLGTVKAILYRAFSQETHLGYTQLRTAIIEASEFVGSPLAKGRAEAFIIRMLNQAYINKFKPEKSKYEAYRLATDTDAYPSVPT